MALIDDIHKKLDERYEARKGYQWDGFKAPEQRPRVRSDQVLALMEVLIEEIESLRDRVRAMDSRD